jgi:hypothetical protein
VQILGCCVAAVMFMGSTSSTARAPKAPSTVPTSLNWKKWQTVLRPRRCRWRRNLSVGDHSAGRLVEAARIFDQIFLKQLWAEIRNCTLACKG